MENTELKKARDYEREAEKKIAGADRPAFHLSARAGWLNDPNGFSYYNGRYHMFYQYHPYASVWGPMHWGHAVSDDLLHWDYLPAALAPDEAYDRDGCFSGSAATLPDGRQLLMYTGVRKEKQPDGEWRDIQTQCLASGDGTDYEKYEGNPVLDEASLPAGASRYDFRDPKMWREKDGAYACVIGNRSDDGSGQILLFTSRDGFRWAYKSTLIQNRNRYGRMWECPDFFPLDGKWVLLASPMDMLPVGFDYHNGDGTLCLIGTYDREAGVFQEEHDQAIDCGIDFYATQTVLTPDNRRVMVGWMQNWDACNLYTPPTSWCGQMSLPRELSIKNGRLCQRPVRELDALRTDEVRYAGLVFTDNLSLEGVRGRIADLELDVAPGDEGEPYREFSIRFAQDERFYTSLRFLPQESTLEIDRRFSNTRRAIVHQRKCHVRHDNGRIRLRLILDRYSAEVFVNDGEQTMTAAVYTQQEADGISFYADGHVKIDVVKYDLG